MAAASSKSKARPRVVRGARGSYGRPQTQGSERGLTRGVRAAELQAAAPAGAAPALHCEVRTPRRPRAPVIGKEASPAERAPASLLRSQPAVLDPKTPLFV